MKNKVLEWLRNPARRYGDGVSLFLEVAPPAIRNQYAEYFQSGIDGMRMGMLHSRLEWLLPNIKSKAPVVTVNDIRKDLVDDLREELKEDLEDDVREELKEDLESDIREELKIELEDDVREELREELESDIREELKEPAEIIHYRDRIREIRPLQASIHASIYPENIPSKRADLRKELLKLESERRQLWQKIEVYEGKETDAPEESEDPVARLIRLKKRAKQLRQNINRAKGRPEKLELYHKELIEIETELNGKKIESR